ncbi:MAG: glycine--tRNA ligase subunit beta [Deltaproteobacteria bacterium]|nr:glycine--tRNA ligase subunit beta [Deltaproteobacteria bacterium]
MASELLLEIGTEEIPAGYLEHGLRGLKALAQTCLRENRIGLAGELVTLGSPRRLVLVGKGVSTMQEDLVKEITGPPKAVAYDAEGVPTKAAVGFARKQGVSVEELGIVETPKGEYLHVKRHIPGRKTAEILAEALPGLIARIPWPKSMRWGSVDFSFVRPVHWVVCLFDGRVIPFEVAGVESGNTTMGHRFMAPEPFEVSDIQGYLAGMERAHVVLDQRERERVVRRITEEAAEKAGGSPVEDPELVSTVANLVEYPSAVCGSFDERFLDLPDVVLITAMREHQKYFALRDHDGRVMPNFVAVNNTVARDETVVQRGHERVLRARLSDADFFLREDRKRPLETRLEDLKQVVYQADLGTSHAKVRRFKALAVYLTGMFLPDGEETVGLVADLCKCDLVTQMVNEFPSLQGVMGEEYARMEGYPEEVCTGISQHYLPLRAGSELPTSMAGALVGVADRMDTIAGCFAVGLEPSGNADPFALRRHSLAIIRIVEAMDWDLSLNEFTGKALALLEGDIEFDREGLLSRIMAFVRERYRNMLLKEGYDPDLIEAVISVDFDRIRRLRPKIDQLRQFASAESEEFKDLAITFKRVKNILKKEHRPCDVDPGLFREECESTLWDRFQTVKDDVYSSIEREGYLEALGLMVRLRKPVDAFFDGVEVLTKSDQALRENRVGILQRISSLMLLIADLSRLSA